MFNNSGLVDTESGAVNFAGGGTNTGIFNAATNTDNAFTTPYTFNDGSTFAGTGSNYWTAAP